MNSLMPYYPAYVTRLDAVRVRTGGMFTSLNSRGTVFSVGQFPKEEPVSLSKTKLSISSLLTLMEKQEPEQIQLNHMVINDHSDELLSGVPLHQLPSFTVRFAGFVEVEFFMDARHESVLRVVVQQAAMTFEELSQNGEPLPSMTVACGVLGDVERARLDAVAQNFVRKGKLLDHSRGEALLVQYLDRSMFSPRHFGPMRHA